jgi:hypothetical protein
MEISLMATDKAAGFKDHSSAIYHEKLASSE